MSMQGQVSSTYCTAMLHPSHVNSLLKLTGRSHSVGCALHYHPSRNCSSHWKVEHGYCLGPLEFWSGNKSACIDHFTNIMIMPVKRECIMHVAFRLLWWWQVCLQGTNATLTYQCHKRKLPFQHIICYLRFNEWIYITCMGSKFCEQTG